MTADLTTYSQNGLDIYFQSQRAGLDAQLVSRLVNFINATQTSLDCAIYDLRQPDVLNALAGVVQAGKQLRIAYDASGQQSGTGDPAADPSLLETRKPCRAPAYSTMLHPFIIPGVT